MPFILMLIQKRKENINKSYKLYTTLIHIQIPFLSRNTAKAYSLSLEETYFIAKQFLYSLFSIVYGKKAC